MKTRLYYSFSLKAYWNYDELCFGIDLIIQSEKRNVIQNLDSSYEMNEQFSLSAPVCSGVRVTVVFLFVTFFLLCPFCSHRFQ